MDDHWLHIHGADITLLLHVQPGARKSELVGRHGDALKLKLAAAPIEGKANDCLIEFVASLLRVPKSSVKLLSGKVGRRKLLRVASASTEAIERLRRLTDA